MACHVSLAPQGAIFYNNFEISHASLWKMPIVRDYLEVIDKNGGIYYTRWGDAPIRSLAVAMGTSHMTSSPRQHQPHAATESASRLRQTRSPSLSREEVLHPEMTVFPLPSFSPSLRAPTVLQESEVHRFSDFPYAHRPFHVSEGEGLPAPHARPFYHLEAASDFLEQSADLERVGGTW